MKASLFDIEEGILNIVELIEEGAEGLEGTLENLQIEKERKVNSIANYIKQLNVESKALKEQEQALKERRESKDKAAKRLQNYLFNFLKNRNVKKFETKDNLLNIAKTPAALVVNNDDKLMQYLEEKGLEGLIKVNVSKTIDKTGIKNRIKEGLEVPKELAEMKSEEVLRIK